MNKNYFMARKRRRSHRDIMIGNYERRHTFDKRQPVVYDNPKPRTPTPERIKKYTRRKGECWAWGWFMLVWIMFMALLLGVALYGLYK